MKQKLSRFPAFVALVFALGVVANINIAAAAPGSVFARAAKRSAKVADDIPLQNVDELAKSFAHNKTARESLENATKRYLKTTEPLVLRNTLKSELHALDPSLVRYADELSDTSKQYLLVLNRGAKSCEKAMPDMLARTRFLQRGGAETVTAIGMYGDDVAKSAMRFDAALQGGKIISPNGMRAVNLDDFGKLFIKHGDAAESFWKQHVTPHWKLWLGGSVGGGALAWYLLDPQGFMDSAGNLTEEGFKRLTQFLGDVGAGVIRGVTQGTITSVETVATTMVKSFFTTWQGIASFFILSFIAALALPFTRHYALRPFRFLLKVPQPKQTSNQTQETQDNHLQ